jgi:flagellar biosynthetic protein FliR
MLTMFTWLLVFVRASGLFLIFPLFSAPNVPVRVRLALAGFLGLAVASNLANPVDLASLNLGQTVLLLFKEVSIGIFLGFICRLVFYAVQIGGHFISTEIGLQTSTLITPTDAVPVDVPGAVLNLLAMMLFLSLDVHHTLIIAFQQSYLVLPIGGGGLTDALYHDLTWRVGRVFLLSVQIAAPLIAIGFLLSTILMMLGRAVPQMNIFFESFTIRLLAGMIVFGLSLTLAAQRMADYMRRVPHDVLEVGKLLGGG